MDDLKRIEKIIRENASEKKEKKPGLKFNLGLALLGLRTTGSRILVDSLCYTKYHSDLSRLYLIDISPRAIFIANNAARAGVRASTCRPI